MRTSAVAKFIIAPLMLIAAGCGGAGLPAETSTATSPAPTKTMVSSPTRTLIPTATLTPTPEKVVLTFTKNAFCRGGPSTQYFDVGSLEQGDTAQAVGRNDTEPRWWVVLKPNGGQCWVSESTVQANVAAEALPVQVPQKSLPQTPPDLWVDRVCKPAGFAVTLNWTPSGTADGYYVYLNGEQIQDIRKPTIKSYVIKLPKNEPVSYALEAYNSIGYGERFTFEDPGCP
jgi:hypothetical protein